MKSTQTPGRKFDRFSTIFTVITAFVFGLSFASHTAAETITLEQVRALLDTARSHRADVFSRGFYEAGLDAYRKALEDSSAGNRTKLLRKRLSEATTYLQQAISTADRFEALFPRLIAAYDSAQVVEARTRAESSYAEASRAFDKCVQLLEKGDNEAASRWATKATDLYRRAWTEAVREEIFGEIRRRYNDLAESEVPSLAPALFQALGDSIAEAEDRIGSPEWRREEAAATANDLADRLAHLLYVTEWIKKLPEGFAGKEQLILQYEETIRQISRELNLNPRFDRDMALNVAAVLSAIRKIRDDNLYLKNELNRRDQQIGELEAKLPKLNSQTDKYLSELETIRSELQAQRRYQEKIRRLTSLIPPEKGIAVYRVRGDSAEIFIRLTGLHFRSGKAAIQPGDTTLLDLTAQIVREFPQSEVLVYGHTDAKGRDDLNLRLSQERAEQVRNHLIKKGAVQPSRIHAIGMGETQPLASNDDKEGRAKNRRVEIIIRNIQMGKPF
jgi:outer membrane protein OmpA-like peptidoglycan-associated protein